MPHKCVKCGLMYGAGAEELFKGCSCSSRIFMFIKPDQISLKEQMEIMERESRSMIAEHKQQLEEIAEIAPISIEQVQSASKTPELSQPSVQPPFPTIEQIEKEARHAKKREEIMQDAAEILEQRHETTRTIGEKPVENITILERGRYELDLNSLMAGNPLVIRSEHGVFYIRIPMQVKKVKAK